MQIFIGLHITYFDAVGVPFLEFSSIDRIVDFANRLFCEFEVYLAMEDVVFNFANFFLRKFRRRENWRLFFQRDFVVWKFREKNWQFSAELYFDDVDSRGEKARSNLIFGVKFFWIGKKFTYFTHFGNGYVNFMDFRFQKFDSSKLIYQFESICCIEVKVRAELDKKNECNDLDEFICVEARKIW